jgi:hypothetical protein
MDIIKPNGGVSLTAGLVSSRVALPIDSKGHNPAAVRVIAMGEASVHVKFGDATVTATASDLLLTHGCPVNVDTSGMTHVATIQAGLNLGGLVNVVPYE